MWQCSQPPSPMYIVDDERDLKPRYDIQQPAFSASFDIALSREQLSAWSAGAEGVNVAEKLTSMPD